MNTQLPPCLSHAVLVGLLAVACGGEKRASFGPGTGVEESNTDSSTGGAGASPGRDAAPQDQRKEGGAGDQSDDQPQEPEEPVGESQDAGSDDAGGTHAKPHTHCGWNGVGWYFCGHNGADPSGQFPIDCPEGLVVGAACGTIGSEGCCDDDDRNWFCTPADRLVVIDCE